MAKATSQAAKKKDERGIEKIGGIPVDAIDQMEAVVAEYGIEQITTSKGNTFGPMLRMAEGIVRLRELMTPDVMKAVMVLQGSQLGFLTDKDRDGGYDLQAVRDVFIEATLMGARPIGNEFNIISRKAYLTLPHFRRKIREFPGLTDLKTSWGLKAAEVKSGTSIDVPYVVTWKLSGNPMRIEGTIPVRVNSGMGADAVLGKTHRKVLNLVWQRVTGSEHTLPEGDVTDCDIPAAVETTADVLTPGRHKVGGNKTRSNTASVFTPEETQEPGPEEDKPFEVTGVMAYAVEQAAKVSGWKLDDAHDWIKDQYGLQLRNIQTSEAYDEILSHFRTNDPDGNNPKG